MSIPATSVNSLLLLTTLNSRYSHTSLGLRYLYANMGSLQQQTRMEEFTIHQSPMDIAEQILAQPYAIIGFGIYIWNVVETTAVITILKQVDPQRIIVIGGPEVSYEYSDMAIFQLADYLICGMADVAFATLCQQLLQQKQPLQKVMQAVMPQLDQLQLPYQYYSDEDIAHRLIYIEASRGCPFSCQFCLSALDKTAWPFPLEAILAQLQQLYDRGVRQFKFVDRTFNLKITTTSALLGFFLQHDSSELRLHFELIPDHLPESLQQLISQFQHTTLQFEVGIQTLNSIISQRIRRKQNNQLALNNLCWLQQRRVHLHTDLIIGLPGETLDSIANGFNQLYRLQVAEIQVGILKRLRGAPIALHSEEFAMRYNPLAPYNILSNSTLDFFTLQRLSRFARYWEIIGNGDRFTHTLPLVLAHDPFAQFLALSDWLYAQEQRTYKIALQRLFRLLWQWLQHTDQCNAVTISALYQDAIAVGERVPGWLQQLVNAYKQEITRKLPSGECDS